MEGLQKDIVVLIFQMLSCQCKEEKNDQNQTHKNQGNDSCHHGAVKSETAVSPLLQEKFKRRV